MQNNIKATIDACASKVRGSDSKNLRGLVMLHEMIDQLKKKVLAKEDISFDEAVTLIQITGEENIAYLSEAAHEITRHFQSNEPGICSLLNAKSYLCGEDCGFCSQSVRFETTAERYDLLDGDVILEAARKAESNGVKNFCLVTSGASPQPDDFQRLLAVFRQLKGQTSLNIDCSIGFLSKEQTTAMKEAGVRRVNHNLQSSREFYPNIVSTHNYDVRVNTVEAIREGGLDLCSGGIFGMGETLEDRVKLAFELKKHNPECVPVNLLNPRPGTPLEDRPLVDPWEALKSIAVFRFIMPKANIKLAGGREGTMKDYQEIALKGGANGLIVGGYLTTKGNPMRDDFAMLERAGYRMDDLQRMKDAKDPAGSLS